MVRESSLDKKLRLVEISTISNENKTQIDKLKRLKVLTESLNQAKKQNEIILAVDEYSMPLDFQVNYHFNTTDIRILSFLYPYFILSTNPGFNFDFFRFSPYYWYEQANNVTVLHMRTGGAIQTPLGFDDNDAPVYITAKIKVYSNQVFKMIENKII